MQIATHKFFITLSLFVLLGFVPQFSNAQKGDLGFAYGAGVDFGLNAAKTFRLGLGFRGVYGLIDISDNSNNNNTNSYYVLDKAHIKTYSAYLGVSFLF